MTQRFEIEIIEEYKLSTSYQKKIICLLQNTFPNYPKGQYYYNQLPSFRYLVWNKDELIGHAGIDHRVINLGNEVFTIFGIVDLCVCKKYQSQNIASFILENIETQAKTSEIDFILLFAELFGIYSKNGFKVVENSSKWLMLRNQQSFGIVHRKLKNCLLYKSISDKKWTNGTLDFLGTVF
jgi:GNAT superfamily N-acetyltransferase